MATKDFFALVREGDGRKIHEYVENLRDLTAIENALYLDPSLVHHSGWSSKKISFSKMIIKMSSEYIIFHEGQLDCPSSCRKLWTSPTGAAAAEEGGQS